MEPRHDQVDDADRIGRIVRSLEEDIALARLLPRERLIEDELSLRFGEGRHVIRQALTELERMGVITRQRNKGAAVKDLTPEDVNNIYALRELLEGRAAELLPLPAPKELIARLHAIDAAHTRAMAEGDLRTVFRANIDFHRTFFRACGNPQLAEAVEIFAWKVHTVRSNPVVRPDLLARANVEHKAIIAAIEACSRADLVRLVVEHIRPSQQAYIAQYRRSFFA
jgi:DNA-binding GntR family transcriptional regulator